MFISYNSSHFRKTSYSADNLSSVGKADLASTRWTVNTRWARRCVKDSFNQSQRTVLFTIATPLSRCTQGLCVHLDCGVNCYSKQPLEPDKSCIVYRQIGVGIYQCVVVGHGILRIRKPKMDLVRQNQIKTPKHEGRRVSKSTKAIHLSCPDVAYTRSAIYALYVEVLKVKGQGPQDHAKY